MVVLLVAKIDHPLDALTAKKHGRERYIPAGFEWSQHIIAPLVNYVAVASNPSGLQPIRKAEGVRGRGSGGLNRCGRGRFLCDSAVCRCRRLNWRYRRW